MRAKRLLALADFLETEVPNKRFDYTNWVGEDWGGDGNLSCGTSACALGWAPQVPMLKRAGLRMVTGRIPGLPRFVPGRGRRPAGPARAAAIFFDLTADEVRFLFLPTGEEEAWFTPKQVARKIRWFLAGNK